MHKGTFKYHYQSSFFAFGPAEVIIEGARETKGFQRVVSFTFTRSVPSQFNKRDFGESQLIYPTVNTKKKRLNTIESPEEICTSEEDFAFIVLFAAHCDGRLRWVLVKLS